MLREEISVFIVIRFGINDDVMVCVGYGVDEKDADAENESDDEDSCRQMLGTKVMPIIRRWVRRKEIQVDDVSCKTMY